MGRRKPSGSRKLLWMLAVPVWAVGVALVLAGREGIGFWLVAIGGATMLALLLSRAGDMGEFHSPPS